MPTQRHTRLDDVAEWLGCPPLHHDTPETHAGIASTRRALRVLRAQLDDGQALVSPAVAPVYLGRLERSVRRADEGKKARGHLYRINPEIDERYRALRSQQLDDLALCEAEMAQFQADNPGMQSWTPNQILETCDPDLSAAMQGRALAILQSIPQVKSKPVKREALEAYARYMASTLLKGSLDLQTWKKWAKQIMIEDVGGRGVSFFIADRPTSDENGEKYATLDDVSGLSYGFLMTLKADGSFSKTHLSPG